MTDIETLAQTIASNNGRPWLDCGEYERESYRDVAANMLDDDDGPNQHRGGDTDRERFCAD